jgi:tetratricopeptide (TPR) repeat protein
MIRQLHTVRDKQCESSSCSRRGQPVGMHDFSCEECKRPLSPIWELDRRAVGLTIAAGVLIVLGLLFVTHLYLVRRAAKQEAKVMAGAGVRLESALRGATAEEVERIATSVQAELRLSDSQRQRLLAGARAQIVALPRGLTPELKPQLEGLLRASYRDGRVSPEERAEIEAFTRQNRLQPTAVHAFENQIAQRVQASNHSLSRGSSLMARGMVAEARGEFQQATESDPVSSMAWANLGAAESTLGHPDEARRSLDQALRLDAGNWLAHYNLGLLAARSGDRDSALRHCEQALGSLPGSMDRERRALVHELLQDPSLAEVRKDPRFEELLGGGVGSARSAGGAHP